MAKDEIGKKYTFWALIKDCSIEIPIIQRDYVQGREKEGRVRTTFLKAINNSLVNNKPLHLDFIYGVIKNNKFIPLDGQQRLTTLFLIHYFLSLKEANKFEIFQEYLIDNNDIKFTYETRKSSKEFCSQLIKNRIKLRSNIKTKKEVKISDLIKNENWFFSKWIQDPTISSMLIMLDEIQNIFIDDDLFEQLISTDNIVSFSFLEPSKLKIKNENELYIKINSRGKSLNEFENFKSYFMGFLNEEQKLKFDNDWFKIFWNHYNKTFKNDNKENEKIIEEKIFGAYLNFFKNLTPFFSDTKEERDILKFEYIQENIEDIARTLNCLMDYKYDEIDKIRSFDTFKIDIFQDFLKNKITFSEKARFYALNLFFVKIGKSNENKKLFKSWMRVSLNLISNMINSYDAFRSMIKLLEDLSSYLKKNNFYEELSKYSFQQKISAQLEEEIEKAKLILNNSENQSWDLEEEFLIAENNWYLDGQIGFLIGYAKWNFNDFSDFNDFYEFQQYRDKFIDLWKFSKDNKENQILIYQALLTKGDYLPKLGNSDNFTFCIFKPNLEDKNKGWRKVFKNNLISLFFKALLDDIEKEIIKQSLNKIIEKYINNFKFPDEVNKNLYVYTLISNSSNINYCKYNEIRYYNYKSIFLLSKTQINGKHSELYSYHFYTKYLKNYKSLLPFQKNDYFYTTSWEQPCAVLDNWEIDHYNFALDISFEDGEYKAKFFDRNENNIDNKYILDGFEKDSNKYVKTLKSINPKDVKNEIEDILNQFSEIE